MSAPALAVLVVLWIRHMDRHHRRHAEQMIIDWYRHFPNRCMLCSLHRQAQFHGDGAKPLGPHVCPEGKSKPWPLPNAWTRMP